MQSYDVLQLPTRELRRRLYQKEIGELEEDIRVVSSLSSNYQGNVNDRLMARNMLGQLTSRPYGVNSLMAMLSSYSRAPLARVMPYSGMGTPPSVAQGLVESYKLLMQRDEDPVELTSVKSALNKVISQDVGLDALMGGLKPKL